MSKANEDKMLNLQLQMKQNNEDLKSFLKDLDSWEEEMKQVDSTLKNKKLDEVTKLPPVRNSLDKKKFKKKDEKKKEGTKKPKRISGYDYRSWDKFDVDKACESDKSVSEEEYETDEEWEEERKKQAAVLEKDKGNEYFKKGDYANAIECYTKGANLDPTNPLLPANRAMALLKQDKFAPAELDCSVALSLDPLYTKAYLRRGSARMGLKKYKEAKADFEKVLQLEPQNKKAKSDLDQIEKELAKESLVSHSEPAVNQSVGVVRAVTKQPSERSKKPLRRIEIEEVGAEDGGVKSAIARTEAAQSKVKRDIVQKDADSFQRFTAVSPADIGTQSFRADQSELTSDDTTENIPSENKNSRNCEKSLEETSSASSVQTGPSKSLTNSVQHGVKENKLSQTSAEPVAASANGSTSPRSKSLNISVPVNSVQFQADYRQLRSDIQAFYKYFKRIRPSEYVKLFGQFLDADVLLTILNVIKECYIPNGDDVFECLHSLASVKRFSMVVMFMSNKEKQVLVELFAHLRKSPGAHTEAEISSLSSKYDLR